MVLSKREKYIGVGTVVAVALLLINSLIIGPYNDKYAELKSELAKANDTLAEDKALMAAQKNREQQWNAMLNSGLRSDDSTARSRSQTMLQSWVRTAGVNFEQINSEPAPSQRGPFQAVNFSLDFSASGNDSMRQIARFLWSVESATIPLRLTSFRIQSTKEGSADLSVKLVVSALYMPTGQNANFGNEMMDALEGLP